MLFANILPIITKPTRLTDQTVTLIDRIIQNLMARISTLDITDHLPNFCFVKTQHRGIKTKGNSEIILNSTMNVF